MLVRPNGAIEGDRLHGLFTASDLQLAQDPRDLQRDLVEHGQHRAISIPDLILAAIADIEQLTVLHYDADFDLIAELTGQPTEWVLPRGTIS